MCKKGIDLFSSCSCCCEGERGPRGYKGDKGENGIDGRDGRDGKDGEQGLRGCKGERGDEGPKGDKGDKGERGADGRDGLKGSQGEKGEQGEKGDKGEKGEKGDKGEQGSSGIVPKIHHANLDAPTKVYEFWLTSNTTVRFEYSTSTAILMRMKASQGTVLVDFKRSKQQGASTASGNSIDNTTITTTYQVIDSAISNNSTEMHRTWIRIRDNTTNKWSLYEIDVFCSNGAARTDILVYTIYKDLDITWSPA